MESPTRSCSNVRPPCRRCPASKPARSPCRTPARNSPRRCSTRAPACACSMPAPRRAARRCTSRSARPISRELVAADDDALRLARVRENLERGRAATRCWSRPICATRPPSLAPRSFDRVLVDAPCSATGVIRRHPDIKLLRRPDDIAGLRGHPARDSRHRFRTTSRPADVSSTAPVRCCPPRTKTWSPAFLDGEPRAAVGRLAGRSRHGRRDCWNAPRAGSCCRVATRAPMASTMLVCKADGTIEGTNAVRARHNIS